MTARSFHPVAYYSRHWWTEIQLFVYVWMKYGVYFIVFKKMFVISQHAQNEKLVFSFELPAVCAHGQWWREQGHQTSCAHPKVKILTKNWWKNQGHSLLLRTKYIILYRHITSAMCDICWLTARQICKENNDQPHTLEKFNKEIYYHLLMWWQIFTGTNKIQI